MNEKKIKRYDDVSILQTNLNMMIKFVGKSISNI
jgi:hypothetical protein